MKNALIFAAVISLMSGAAMAQDDSAARSANGGNLTRNTSSDPIAKQEVTRSKQGYSMEGDYFGEDGNPVAYTYCNGGTWVQVHADPDRYVCRRGIVKGTGPLRGHFIFL